MAKRNKLVAPVESEPPEEVAAAVESEAEITPPVADEPAEPEAPAGPVTIADLLAERGITGKVDGDTLKNLQREMRRRNRKAEKGY